MDMRQITAMDVHARKVAELGLDATAVDLTSIEAVAGALRRAASFLCPCAAATLIRSVVRPLRGLVNDIDVVRSLVEETLEGLIAHGDILEQREIGNDNTPDRGTLLYAAPASFVLRQSGAAILLGVAADNLSALPDEFQKRIEYINHVRWLTSSGGENLRTELVQLGLIELSYNEWLKFPQMETAVRHLAQIDALLDAAQPSRDIPGLLLLDSERPVHYYRGRWVEPRLQSGRFVARRSQAYGADLWCYVQLRDGHPETLIDFPIRSSRWRGCDEAWRLQMAIDASRGQPQRFRVRPGTAGTVLLELFSPVPMWARRRWDAVGEPVPTSGCLFAYRFAKIEGEEELRFAHEALWLEETQGSTKP